MPWRMSPDQQASQPASRASKHSTSNLFHDDSELSARWSEESQEFDDRQESNSIHDTKPKSIFEEKIEERENEIELLRDLKISENKLLAAEESLSTVQKRRTEINMEMKVLRAEEKSAKKEEKKLKKRIQKQTIEFENMKKIHSYCSKFENCKIIFNSQIVVII